MSEIDRKEVVRLREAGKPFHVIGRMLDHSIEGVRQAYIVETTGSESPATIRARKKYEKSEKFREVQARHRLTGARKEAVSRYNRSEKGKATQKRYFQTEKGKEASRRARRVYLSGKGVG